MQGQDSPSAAEAPHKLQPSEVPQPYSSPTKPGPHVVPRDGTRAKAVVIVFGLLALLAISAATRCAGTRLLKTTGVSQRDLSRSLCGGLANTPYFSQYYGSVLINGADAPPGMLIELYSPRGDRVGCSVTTAAGIYPYTRAYGEDATAASPIRGMRAGEEVTFKVNGIAAATDPSPVLWRDDKVTHQVNLSISAVTPTVPNR